VSAPKLTALATVRAVGGGEIHVSRKGEFVCTVAVNSETERAWASVLCVDNAVRVTVEPVASPAALRPAEEIARGMVSAEKNRYSGHEFSLTVSFAGIDAAVDAEDKEGVTRLVSVLARLIEQSRAERAAAERVPNHNPAVCQDALDSIRRGPDSDMRLAAELGYQASVEPHGPRREVMRLAADRLRAMAETQPRDLASAPRATNCGTCAAALTEEGHRVGCDEPTAVAQRQRMAALLRVARRWHATASDEGHTAEDRIAADIELAEAVETLAWAQEQPPDLADRIRALVQEYAGRESDASIVDDDDAYYIASTLTIELNDARCEFVKHGRIPQRWWDEMRAEHSEGPKWTDARRRCADELEAIVRECADETAEAKR
jgi:hypothetical protein